MPGGSTRTLFGNHDVHAPVAGKDRTRAAMAAVFGGLRTGCGSGSRAGGGDRLPCGMTRGQAFLVSQKMRSISAMSSSAFSPVFGSVDALAAERAFRVSLTSWLSSGYFSKCGALK